MLYLVTGEWVEVGALLPPEQLVPILDEAILPSLEKLAQWEEEGKIHGGIFTGERAGAWVMEAGSSEEVGEFWPAYPSGAKSSGMCGLYKPCALPSSESRGCESDFKLLHRDRPKANPIAHLTRAGLRPASQGSPDPR